LASRPMHLRAGMQRSSWLRRRKHSLESPGMAGGLEKAGLEAWRQQLSDGFRLGYSSCWLCSDTGPWPTDDKFEGALARAILCAILLAGFARTGGLGFCRRCYSSCWLCSHRQQGSSSPELPASRRPRARFPYGRHSAAHFHVLFQDIRWQAAWHGTALPRVISPGLVLPLPWLRFGIRPSTAAILSMRPCAISAQAVLLNASRRLGQKIRNSFAVECGHGWKPEPMDGPRYIPSHSSCSCSPSFSSFSSSAYDDDDPRDT